VGIVLGPVPFVALVVVVAVVLPPPLVVVGLNDRERLGRMPGPEGADDDDDEV